MTSRINTPTYNDYPHYDDNMHGENDIMIHEQEQLVYHYPVSLRLLSFILSLLFGFLSFISVCVNIIAVGAWDAPTDDKYSRYIVLPIYIAIMLIMIRITTVFIYITLYGITPKSCKKPYNTMYNIMFGCCCFDQAQRLQYTTNDNINYHNLNVEMR